MCACRVPGGLRQQMLRKLDRSYHLLDRCSAHRARRRCARCALVSCAACSNTSPASRLTAARAQAEMHAGHEEHVARSRAIPHLMQENGCTAFASAACARCVIEASCAVSAAASASLSSSPRRERTRCISSCMSLPACFSNSSSLYLFLHVSQTAPRTERPRQSLFPPCIRNCRRWRPRHHRHRHSHVCGPVLQFAQCASARQRRRQRCHQPGPGLHPHPAHPTA